MFAAGVGYSPNEFQSDRGRFANLLSLKQSTIVHVANNPLKDSCRRFGSAYEGRELTQSDFRAASRGFWALAATTISISTTDNSPKV